MLSTSKDGKSQQDIIKAIEEQTGKILVPGRISQVIKKMKEMEQKAKV